MALLEREVLDAERDQAAHRRQGTSRKRCRRPARRRWRAAGAETSSGMAVLASFRESVRVRRKNKLLVVSYQLLENAKAAQKGPPFSLLEEVVTS